ncbi:MAG: protein kinase [Candidatus Palauibacterales bacterium]|nr:protein kinase [Candidatus Palauibacterales bacterium]
MSDLPARLTAALAARYRIQRELGEGGMATVYLAEDLKHDRKVAIKVLKPELAAVLGADRFLAEIKTTASLQHPNILPLFDSGTADGFLYYVMPFVEGESLRDRLNREKQLPVREAVDLTSEVADALQYAHEHGVVHRDIKPENILLHGGRPMVADFGIALAVSAAAGGRMTETGLSLGTPHYMSPEQATAEPDITGRSDVYSLASVLYEMLTGDPPHTGSSAQQIIMKIVTEEAAPVTKLRRSVPPNVSAALTKGLEKLPADRFGSAKAFAGALADPGFRHGAAGAAGAGPAGARATWRERAAIPLAGAAAVLLVAALWGWLRPGPTPPPVSRETVVLGPTLPRMIAGGVAIAPDGSAIVYTDTVGGRKLWIKERGEADPRPLADLTHQAGGFEPEPSFSPDGRWIVYADLKLMRVARGGGAPVTMSDSAAGYGTAWLDDGTVVFGNRSASRLFRTSADGGATTLLTDSLGGSLNGGGIAPVPGSHAVMAGVSAGARGTSEVVVDVKTGAVRTLVPGATGAWIVPGGDLVYARTDGGLYAAAFDRGKLQLAGPSVSVLAGIGEVALGRDGTMLYVRGGTTTGGASEVVSVSRDGSDVVRLDRGWSAPVASAGGLALSPDGSKVALSVRDSTTGRVDVVVVPVRAGPTTRLTSRGAGVNIRPAWSPNGRKVLYVSAEGDGTARLWERAADGAGRAAPVPMAEKRSAWEGLWSPDGKWIVYRTYDGAAGNGDILAVRTSGDSTPVPLAHTDAQEYGPALSPDGRWLAFTSSSSGRMEIYVCPFPDARDGLYPISSDGGTEAEWSHDGRQLFYRNGAGEMIAVDVTTGSTFSAGAHHPLFDARGYLANFQSHFYAVTPDDHRFVMVRPVEGSAGAATPPRLVLARHWLAELRAKLKGAGGS